MDRTSARERRKLVQQEIQQQQDETRFVKAVEMGNQGNWTRCEAEQRELIWSDILKYTSFQLQFLLRAVYDVLPTPTNLRTWGLTEDPMCRLYCAYPGKVYVEAQPGTQSTFPYTRKTTDRSGEQTTETTLQRRGAYLAWLRTGSYKSTLRRS